MNTKTIALLTNFFSFIGVMYTTSYIVDRGDVTYTNQVAEFVADPLAIIWILSYFAVLVLLLTSEE